MIDLKLACASAAAIAALVGSAAAQQSIPQPRLQSVFPLGGKAGTSVEVRIAGDALDGADRVYFTHPGLTAQPANDGRFLVAIAPDVPPGVYEMRAVNSLGVSNARNFAVGDRPEKLEAEPNDDDARATPLALDTVANGVCDARGFDVYRVRAAKGQRLILQCAAQYLDARTDAVLTVRDASGATVARAHDAVRLDPVIDFTAPADGDYFVAVNDFRYRGGDGFGYRLAASTGPWVDRVEPPVVKPAARTQVILHGRNFPGGAASREFAMEAPRDGFAVDTLLRPTEIALPSLSVRPPGAAFNPLRVHMLDQSLQHESEPNDAGDKAQAIQLPAQILGRFGGAADRDWFVFDAKKGERLWIEVVSQRLGLPTDASLLVQRVTTDDKGQPTFRDVSAADDPPKVSPQFADDRRLFVNVDPGAPFTAPEDGRYAVLVRDLAAGAGEPDPRLCYLLSVRPPQPDFQLVMMTGMSHPLNNNPALPGGALLRRGGSVPVEVIALRREGFEGAIKVSFDGGQLPPGVTASPAVIGPWGDSATLVLQASNDVTAPALHRQINVVGRASIDGTDVTRPAHPVEAMGTLADGDFRSTVRHVRELPLAVRADVTPPCSIQPVLPANGEPIRAARGELLRVPMRLTRHAAYDRKIDCSIVGLHPTMTIKEFVFDVGETDKTMEIELEKGAPLGTFTFTVRAELIVSNYPLPGGPKDARVMAVSQPVLVEITDKP